MPQERAKFAGEVRVNSATAIYADGHEVEHGQDEMKTFAFKPLDRQTFASPLDLVMHSFKLRNIKPLQAVPNETLAYAAQHGEAMFVSVLNVTVEDRPELLSTKSRDLLVTVNIKYTITVRRQLDA